MNTFTIAGCGNPDEATGRLQAAQANKTWLQFFRSAVRDVSHHERFNGMRTKLRLLRERPAFGRPVWIIAG
jgi:hypothetical protein